MICNKSIRFCEFGFLPTKQSLTIFKKRLLRSSQLTITSVYFPSTSPFKHFVSKPRDVEQWFVTLLAEFNFLVGEIQPLRENCSAFVLNIFTTSLDQLTCLFRRRCEEEMHSCDLLSISVLCIIVTNWSGFVCLYKI